MKARLEIIIPTYNRYNHLTNTLKRLLDIKKNTTKLVTEIIILDNNSDDKRYKLLRNSTEYQYQKNDNNIGLYGNISKAFAISKADWLLVLSDDDKLEISSFDFIISINCEHIILNSTSTIGNIRTKKFYTDAEILDNLPMYSCLGFISINLYSKKMVDSFKTFIKAEKSDDHWTLFPHIKYLFMHMNLVDSHSIYIPEKEYSVVWNTGNSSWDNEFMNAIRGMLYLGKYCPNYKQNIFNNFYSFYSYHLAIKRVFFHKEFNFIPFLFRTFGIKKSFSIINKGVIHACKILIRKLCGK